MLIFGVGPLGSAHNRSIGCFGMRFVGVVLSIVVYAGAGTAMGQQVLVLYEESGHTKSMNAFEAGLRNGLWAYDSGEAVSVFNEEMDLRRLPRDGYETDLKKLLQAKYRGVQFDAVVPVGKRAAAFLAEGNETIFPGTPIVFCGLSEQGLDHFDFLGKAVAVPEGEVLEQTVELAFAVKPEARKVVLIGGRSEQDEQYRNRIESLVSGYGLGIEIEYFDYRNVRILKRRLSELRGAAFALFWDLSSDGISTSYWKFELIENLSKVSEIPIYGFDKEFLGRGLTGGCFVDYEALGGEVAEVVTRLQVGGDGSAAVAFPRELYSFRFDNDELRKHGISERLLASKGYYSPSPTDRFGGADKLALIAFGSVAVFGVVGLGMYRMRRRQKEPVLRQVDTEISEEVLDRLPIPIWIADASGEIRFLNRYWKDLLNSKEPQTEGPSWEEIVYPEDLADFLYEFRLAVVNGGVFSFESRLLSGKNEYKWFSHSALPVMNSDGELSHYVGLSENVTKRHDLEVEVEESRRELAHLSRITMIGALSSSFAHELNQPLGSILVNAQSALRFLALDPPDLNEVRDILRDIVKEDQRAGEIISRTRQMLKKGECPQTKFNVSRMLEEVSLMLKSELMHRGVRLSLQIEDEDLEVCGDPLSIQQVLINLVMNASEAMEELEKGKRRIVVRSRLKLPSELWLSVSDNGPGISAKLREQLFEPFYTTKRKGLGLGLAICRSIASDHGGKLWAENQLSGGSIFTLSIPMFPRGQKEEPSLSSVQGSGKDSVGRRRGLQGSWN